MEHSSLNLALLKEALQLVEKKEALQAQLAEVDLKLRRWEGGTALTGPRATAILAEAAEEKIKEKTAAKRPAAPTSKGIRARGGLKDRILPLLQASGPEGLAAADLATTLGVPAANVHVWFSTTGKKDPAIQKVGRGRFAWIEAASSEASQRLPEAHEQTEAGATLDPVGETLIEPVQTSEDPAETPPAAEVSVEPEPEAEPMTDVTSEAEPEVEITPLAAGIETNAGNADIQPDLLVGAQTNEDAGELTR